MSTHPARLFGFRILESSCRKLSCILGKLKMINSPVAIPAHSRNGIVRCSTAPANKKHPPVTSPIKQERKVLWIHDLSLILMRIVYSFSSTIIYLICSQFPESLLLATGTFCKHSLGWSTTPIFTVTTLPLLPLITGTCFSPTPSDVFGCSSYSTG